MKTMHARKIKRKMIIKYGALAQLGPISRGTDFRRYIRILAELQAYNSDTWTETHSTQLLVSYAPYGKDS